MREFSTKQICVVFGVDTNFYSKQTPEKGEKFCLINKWSFHRLIEK